jgi:hypothetical protein
VKSLSAYRQELPLFEVVGVIYARAVATPAPAGPNTRHQSHRMRPDGAVREQPSTRFTQSLRGMTTLAMDGFGLVLEDDRRIGVDVGRLVDRMIDDQPVVEHRLDGVDGPDRRVVGDVRPLVG